MDFDNFDKNKIELNGFIEKGKQYDIEVKVPEDKRSVVFGIVKDEYGDPICDAVVKLIEVEKMLGKEERKPVSHTFTNEYGEFVFGPLCPDRKYAIDIWVNDVRNYKYTAICHRDGECLKAKPIINCDCKKEEHKPCEKKEEK